MTRRLALLLALTACGTSAATTPAAAPAVHRWTEAAVLPDSATTVPPRTTTTHVSRSYRRPTTTTTTSVAAQIGTPLQETQEAASRIITALYGKDVCYRAPETFEPGHRALVLLALGEQSAIPGLVDEVEALRATHEANR